MKRTFFLILTIALISAYSECLAKRESPLKDYPHLYKLLKQANDSVLQPSCLKYCRQLYKKGQEENVPVAQCMALQAMSIHYFQVGDYSKILNAVEECKKVCKTPDCVLNLYGIWNNAVIYSLNSDKLSEAIDQLKLMQRYALRHNHPFGIMKSYYGLGNCFSMIGQYGKAYGQYTHALKVVKENKLSVAGSEYVNMAQNAIMIHKYNDAERLLEKVIKDQDTPKFLLVHVYSLLFGIYCQPDNLDKHNAMKYKRLLEKENPKDDLFTEASLIAYNNSFYYYYTYLTHDYAKADKYIVVDNDSMDYYVRKAQNMNSQNKKDLANKYYQEAIRFYDTEHEQENIDQLEQFTTKNNLDKALEERNALKEQNAQLRDKWHKIVALSVFSLMIIVFGISSLLFFRRIRQLKKRKEQAELSEQRKTLFLQNMSHEIRTPLNAIVGFTDLLTSDMQEYLSLDERNMMVNLIRSNSELLGILINDILDVSKFESGTYHLNYSDMNVFELCGAMVETVRSRVQPGVELIYEPGDREFILHTDAQRVQQVILNYLTNACKYTPSGKIVVAYEILEGLIRFTVTDTGMGVKPEDAGIVFQRFQMLDSKISGNGLGLHICSLIAKLLKGRVYVDTSYTDGARFVFDHPLALIMK